MRRDLDLIRDILLAVGNSGASNSFEIRTTLSKDAEEVDYHVYLLVREVGFLASKEQSPHGRGGNVLI